MSDIGILSDPLSLAFVFLIIGSPGLPLGAIAGALLWRRHRILGALLGAVAGFAVWLAGWMVYQNVT
jgi:Na+/proline symporter